MKWVVVLLLLVSAQAQTSPVNAADSSLSLPATAKPRFAAQNTSAPGQVSSPAKPGQTRQVLPDEGTVTGNRYTNFYFGFTYTFPETFEVIEDFMQGEEDLSRQAFVLLAAYGKADEDKRKPGVVVIADRLQQTPPGANWASVYLQKLVAPLQAHGAQLAGPEREYSFAGMKFYRADFRRGGPGEGYQTILFTARRGYALGFQFVAPAEKDIEQLMATLNSLRFSSTGQKPSVSSPKQ